MTAMDNLLPKLMDVGGDGGVVFVALIVRVIVGMVGYRVKWLHAK